MNHLAIVFFCRHKIALLAKKVVIAQRIVQRSRGLALKILKYAWDVDILGMICSLVGIAILLMILRSLSKWCQSFCFISHTIFCTYTWFLRVLIVSLSCFFMFKSLKQEIQCYICKEFGHLCCVDSINTDPCEVSCYKCGRLGHTGLVSLTILVTLCFCFCYTCWHAMFVMFSYDPHFYKPLQSNFCCVVWFANCWDVGCIFLVSQNLMMTSVFLLKWSLIW